MSQTKVSSFFQSKKRTLETPSNKPYKKRKIVDANLDLKKEKVDSSSSNSQKNQLEVKPRPTTKSKAKPNVSNEANHIFSASRINSFIESCAAGTKGTIKNSITSNEDQSQDIFKKKIEIIGSKDDLKNQINVFLKAVDNVKTHQNLKKAFVEKSPAFERFKSLTDHTPSLSLPSHYSNHEETFSHVDTVVALLHKRSEICTFSKLKSSVQKMIRRDFNKKNLGQILTVYPESLSLKQEKDLPVFGDEKSSSYQLTIDINSLDGTDEESLSTLDQNGKPCLTASRLLKRKKNFHINLIQIVKKYHREFLQQLPVTPKVDENKISRWHPKFRLDKLPDIEPSELPAEPESLKFYTAKDVLKHAKNGLNAKVRHALELATEEPTYKEQKQIQENKNNNSCNSSQKPEPLKASQPLTGVTQSLLEHIRNKEARKAEASIMMSSLEAKHKLMVDRMPELARILRGFFVTKKKPALPYKDVLQKLSESYNRSISYVEAEKHLLMMVKLVPEWLQILKLKTGEFVKLDKNLDLKIVDAKLKNNTT